MHTSLGIYMNKNKEREEIHWEKNNIAKYVPNSNQKSTYMIKWKRNNTESKIMLRYFITTWYDFLFLLATFLFLHWCPFSFLYFTLSELSFYFSYADHHLGSLLIMFPWNSLNDSIITVTCYCFQNLHYFTLIAPSNRSIYLDI